jgi:hypothetical protein
VPVMAPIPPTIAPRPPFDPLVQAMPSAPSPSYHQAGAGAVLNPATSLFLLHHSGTIHPSTLLRIPPIRGRNQRFSLPWSVDGAPPALSPNHLIKNAGEKSICKDKPIIPWTPLYTPTYRNIHLCSRAHDISPFQARPTL